MIMSGPNDENETERLSLRLPIGLKQKWKDKARKRNYKVVWKYINHLIDSDIQSDEMPPRALEMLEKLRAENQFLHDKISLLIAKISSMEELLTTKTLIQRTLSEKEKQKILMAAAAPGKKLSEIADHIKKDEIETLGILDTLEGMGKIHLEIETGLWIAHE